MPQILIVSLIALLFGVFLGTGAHALPLRPGFVGFPSKTSEKVPKRNAVLSGKRADGFACFEHRPEQEPFGFLPICAVGVTAWFSASQPGVDRVKIMAGGK